MSNTRKEEPSDKPRKPDHLPKDHATAAANAQIAAELVADNPPPAADAQPSVIGPATEAVIKERNNPRRPITGPVGGWDLD